MKMMTMLKISHNMEMLKQKKEDNILVFNKEIMMKIHINLTIKINDIKKQI